MWITEERLCLKFRNKTKNASARGIKNGLSLDDLREIFSRNKGVCDYTGIPFDEKSLTMGSSIERIDPTLGYVQGNICIVSIQANMLKDTILDRVELKGFRISREDVPLIAAITVKLNANYLEHLKVKYDPRVPYDEETDPYKGYFDDLTGKQIVSTLPPVKEVLPTKEKETMSQDQWSEEKKQAYKLPEDVRIATYYSALAKAAGQTGMEFKITYAEFKGRFARKTCAFSGKVLTPDTKFMLVMDKAKPFSKENISLVDEDFGHKLTKMSHEMGLSVDQLAKMFKRLA